MNRLCRKCELRQTRLIDVCFDMSESFDGFRMDAEDLALISASIGSDSVAAKFRAIEMLLQRAKFYSDFILNLGYESDHIWPTSKRRDVRTTHLGPGSLPPTGDVHYSPNKKEAAAFARAAEIDVK